MFEPLESRSLLSADMLLDWNNAVFEAQTDTGNDSFVVLGSDGSGSGLSAATGTIEGVLWNDLNNDGDRDTGESGLPGWTVFLDSNRNGSLNSGEAMTLTTSTGAYSFTGLAAGSYTVAEVVPAGWEQTFPGNGGNNFLELVGRWTSSVGTAVAGQGVQLAASEVESGFDTHEEELPGGSGELWGDLWAEGDFAYLGHYSADSKVDIIDIADPSDPFLAAQWTAPLAGLQFADVQVHGGIGYFASDNGGGVYIVNLSDPHNPVTVSHIGSAQSGHDNVHTIDVDGNFLYEADSRTRTIKVFNVANPANPVFIRNITSSFVGAVHEVTVRNGRLYTSVITGSGGTDIFDVSNVTNSVTLLGGFASGTASHTAWPSADGKLLAVARETNGGDVKLWNIENPANVTLVATINAAAYGINGFTAHQPMIVGDRLYVAWYQAGTQVFDISNPAQPKLLGGYDTYAGSVTPYAGNWGVYALLGPDRILASDIDSGLFIFSTAETRAHTVTVAEGETRTGIDFGNHQLSQANPPILAPIGNQTMADSTTNLVLQLSATDANNDPLTFSATAQSIEYHLDQTLGLGFAGGNEYLNWGGRNEKWFTGSGGTWYYITPAGNLYRWLGSGNLANDQLVEQVSTADYANTALLYAAQANNAPAIVSVNVSTLTINPNDNFAGKFVVTVSVTDGALSDSELFYVTVTAVGADTTPPTVTNRTPANGAMVTTASTNIDVSFSETVVGVDVTDLVLTGSGAAGAVKSAPTNIGGNTWRFGVSGLQNGPVNVSLAPDANDIEDTAGNDLAPTSWSFTVSIADTTPPTVTNRTPANGAMVTTASTNIDVSFSETVVGVDVTDLVLTGSGAAGVVKSAPTNIGGNTWRFGVSGLQNGSVNVSLAPDANDIEDTAGNDLAPTSWSFTVDIPSAQQPPVLAPIGDQTINSGTQDRVIQLSASDPNNDPLTYSASAQSIEYHLDQTLGLGFSGGNEWLNWGGRNEKWFTGQGGTWYYITPDGKLYSWLGSSNLANDLLVEQLSTNDYIDTSRLYNAQANNAPAVVSVNGSILTINPTDSFSGKFVITVNVNDGQGGIDSETFFVTVL